MGEYQTTSNLTRTKISKFAKNAEEVSPKSQNSQKAQACLIAKAVKAAQEAASYVQVSYSKKTAKVSTQDSEATSLAQQAVLQPSYQREPLPISQPQHRRTLPTNLLLMGQSQKGSSHCEKHFERTKEAIAESMSPKLRYLRDISDHVGVFEGRYTRGRKPNGYVNMNDPVQLEIALLLSK